jgi:hypothetical protein
MDDLRFAGELFDLDLKKGLKGGNLDSLRRSFRSDKLIPSLQKTFNAMSPENSEPEYTMSGSYQPEVAYGA